jgi:UDP-glucuronate decarboxylase
VQALRDEPLTIYGDGSQTRSFCYVSDLIPALIRLMDTSEQVTGPVNLGNPTEFTMLGLAESVIAAAASKSTVTFLDLPSDDPRQRKPDITLAKEVLGWEPAIRLEQGLSKTIEYFARRLQELQLIEQNVTP